MDVNQLRIKVEKMFDRFMKRLCELKSDKNMKCIFVPELSQADTKNFMAWAYLQGLSDKKQRDYLKKYKLTKAKE